MSAPPLKVLVVDDEPPIRKLLRMGLETQGYQTIDASNAKAALELMSDKPDLVILDLGLPDMQGLELLRQIRATVKTPMAALPVPYRTNDKEPTFQSLCDSHWHYAEGSRPFPIALDPFTCNRFEIGQFGRDAMALDIRYLGVCCGAGPHHIRALAEAVGKHPPASKYSPDMSKHAFLGSHERIKQVQKDYANKL